MVGAAIDLGSNSFICLIFKVGSAGTIDILHDEVVLTRLSEGVDKDKRLTAAALERTEKAFQRFSKLFEQYEVEKILGVATSAARDAENQEEFLALAKKYNISIQILSGVEEAQMTFEGVRDIFVNKSGIIVDIGGGSTEYIFVKHGEIAFRTSLNLGVVRFTERYNAFSSFKEKESQIRLGIVEALNANPDLVELKKQKVDILLAVSGTPTNAASLVLGKFDPQKIEGFELKLKDLQKLTLEYSYKNLEDRLAQFPFVEEKRADVLPVGLAILEESMKFFEIDKYVVSTKGIRHGAAKLIVKNN